MSHLNDLFVGPGEGHYISRGTHYISRGKHPAYSAQRKEDTMSSHTLYRSKVLFTLRCIRQSLSRDTLKPEEIAA